MNRCCETCRHDLGGGYDNCRLNIEAECAGGGYEAWEPKEEQFERDAINHCARMIAEGLASTGLMSREIIAIALARPVEKLFGKDENVKEEQRHEDH